MAGTEHQGEVRAMASVVALLFTLFAMGSCTSQVPFVMWSSGGLPPMASPAAGHITTTDQLVVYIKSAFSSAPCTVLLFLQDKLSKEDFTVFGGVFGNKPDSVFPNLEAALHSSSSASLVLPSVEWSSSSTVPALLQEQLGVSPLLVDADTLSDLPLNASGCTFLIINLPYNTDSKFPKEVLRNNDEIIGKVLSIMEAKSISYTAIYTGLQPSRVIAQTSMSIQPVGRSLLQAVETTVKPPIVFNVTGVPCIMLWARNLTVSFTGTSWTDLATETPTLAGSLCNDTISLLVLNYASGITLRFSMTKKFYPVSGRSWSTLNTVLLQNGTDATQMASFSSRHIYTPAEYSFSCQSVKSWGDGLLVPNGTTLLRVNFIEFQIQGFGLTDGNFSYASDCAGFFTPGIWMGLLTSLLMLWIFFYGLHMIMQINTMDRFDDPKGPQITVPQSE